MDPNNGTETPAPETPAPTPAPEPNVEDASKAPDVSMSLGDTSAAPAAPATDAAPAAAPMTPTAENPGHGLGIASLIVSILGAGLIGIILGVIGLNKSKKAGQKNGLALAGIIVGALNLIVVTIIIVVSLMGVAQLATKCAELGTGTHIESGVTITCS
jgi:hypothetical protein